MVENQRFIGEQRTADDKALWQEQLQGAVGADGPAGARTKQYVNGGDPGGGRPPGEGGFDYFDPERNNAGWWGECECRVIRVRLAG